MMIKQQCSMAARKSVCAKVMIVCCNALLLEPVEHCTGTHLNKNLNVGWDLKMYLQWHYTHQKLLQHSALLPQVHCIELKRALRDENTCKLSCIVPLSLSIYCLLSEYEYLQTWLQWYLLKQIKIFGHNLFKMQSCFDRKFCCSSCRSERETVAGVVFGSFKWWDYKSEKVNEYQSN
jgi:hypothetical protein